MGPTPDLLKQNQHFNKILRWFVSPLSQGTYTVTDFTARFLNHAWSQFSLSLANWGLGVSPSVYVCFFSSNFGICMPVPPTAKTFWMIKGDNGRKGTLQWWSTVPLVGINCCHYNHITRCPYSSSTDYRFNWCRVGPALVTLKNKQKKHSSLDSHGQQPGFSCCSALTILLASISKTFWRIGVHGSRGCGVSGQLLPIAPLGMRTRIYSISPEMPLLGAFYLYFWLVILKPHTCLLMSWCMLNAVSTWRASPALLFLCGAASISPKQGVCVWGKDMGLRSRRPRLDANTFLLVFPGWTTWTVVVRST